MRIDAEDLAELSDEQLKGMVVAFHTESRGATGAVGRLFRAIGAELILEVRRRRLIWIQFESEMLDDHEAGGLVEPDTDPVAEAEDEFRRALNRDARRDAGEDVC